MVNGDSKEIWLTTTNMLIAFGVVCFTGGYLFKKIINDISNKRLELSHKEYANG